MANRAFAVSHRRARGTNGGAVQVSILKGQPAAINISHRCQAAPPGRYAESLTYKPSR
jgi:hypothetical protein